MNQDMIDVLNLPKREFIELNLKWIEEEHDGKLMNVKPHECPLALWVAHNDAKCHREMVPNTKECPLCGHPICPDCGNHVVDVISRVTGYLSTVSGWNEAKQQEFNDRTRYDVGGGPRGR
jgi:hypothetical protein